jgi:hypothetical protein
MADGNNRLHVAYMANRHKASPGGIMSRTLIVGVDPPARASVQVRIGKRAAASAIAATEGMR